MQTKSTMPIMELFGILKEKVYVEVIYVPKPTFLNLNEKKRQKFIDVALQEFADYEYRAASLNRIVAGADIAKGSIYQYFENKRDLYEYLVLYAAKEKYLFIALHLSEDATLLKTVLTELFTLGRVFDFQKPIHGKLLVNTASEVENDELDNFLLSVKKQSDSFYVEFCKNAVLHNLIKRDTDIEAAGYLINRFDTMIGEYFEKQSGRPYLELVLDKELPNEHKLAKIKPAIDYFVNILLAAFSR
ncbi:MAG: TetR/AcrR family transcriptional regulator [Firmicutes bacterium]|nr:TetR/AcrR family transcriptional regulator [Bacillota bacterium]MDD4693495.1 TetR/AcrR family transcriptional regulator [Bacillota bacterium]